MNAREKLTCLIGFLRQGYVINLRVEGGEPVVDPLPTLVHFALVREGAIKHALLDPNHEQNFDMLFEMMSRLDTGVIEHIEVKSGSPFLVRSPNLDLA